MIAAFQIYIKIYLKILMQENLIKISELSKSYPTVEDGCHSLEIVKAIKNLFFKWMLGKSMKL